MNNSGNMNTAANTQPEGNGSGVQSTFTQEDVNRIVSERLARERAKNEPTEETKREQALQAREAKLECREYIAEKGYPKELIDILNTADAVSFKKTVDKLNELYSKTAPKIFGATPSSSPTKLPNDNASLRKAFSLN